MVNKLEFTFEYVKEIYRNLLLENYKFLTCFDYFKSEKNLNEKVVVNRVDVDLSMRKAERLCNIFNELNIKASFFFRLHAPEYNIFSFENYRILKHIQSSGHEIGYHSEIVDQEAIWDEPAAICLKRDLDVFESILGERIVGVASHGGLTGLNNLDFWKDKKPSDYGIEYEAYDDTNKFGLFNKSFYVSDSEWTKWKCYLNGNLMKDDHRTPIEHAVQGQHKLIYMLVHPDTYYHRHPYE